MSFMSELIVLSNVQKLQEASEDLPKKMSWYEAIQACHNLKNGWRLPTLNELKLIYKELHLKKKGGFKPSAYWSNMETDAASLNIEKNGGWLMNKLRILFDSKKGSSNDAWGYDFGSGDSFIEVKGSAK